MDWPICTSRLLDQNFGVGITPEDILLPFYSTRGPNYYRSWKLFTEGVANEFGSTIDNTQDDFKISLDVQHFQPNEIDIRVNDKEIIIEGKHKEIKDEHGFISRQFTRRYALPRECPAESVTSTLSSDGVLSIVAKKNVSKSKEEKTVPIKMCGPAKTEERKITTDVVKNYKTVMNKEMQECKVNTDAMEKATEMNIETVALDKKDKQLMLREEHCRLMKPELLKEAAAATGQLSFGITTESEFEETIKGTEKILSESRKETDELLKLISSDKTAQTAATSEMLQDALGQCKTAIAELKDKGAESVMSLAESSNFESSETSSFKSSMVSETFENQEISMASNIKVACEKTTDAICAELKEAAENI